MKMGWWRGVGWLLALGAIGVVTTPAPVAAQQVERECRCVDADGDAIEDCSCFRMPRLDGFAMAFSGARPRLGLSVRPSQDSGTDARGAEVTRVMENGPADRAGLREDDVITSIDGHSLFDPLPGDAEDDFDLDESVPVQRLLAIARDLEPGQEVEIEYLRGGTTAVATLEAEDLSGRSFSMVMPDFDSDELRVRIDEYTDRIREQARDFRYDRPDVVWAPDGERRFGFMSFGSALGVDMIQLSPGLGEYFGVDEGVLVTDVDDDQPLGLRPGDVILSIDGREATSPSRVRRILGSYAADEEVTLRVQRDGGPIEIVGTIDG